MEEYGEEGPRRSLPWEGLAIGVGCLAAACFAPAPLLACLCGGCGVASLLIAATATRPEEPPLASQAAPPPVAPTGPPEEAEQASSPARPPATRWTDRAAIDIGPRSR